MHDTISIRNPTCIGLQCTSPQGFRFIWLPKPTRTKLARAAGLTLSLASFTLALTMPTQVVVTISWPPSAKQWKHSAHTLHLLCDFSDWISLAFHLQMCTPYSVPLHHLLAQHSGDRWCRAVKKEKVCEKLYRCNHLNQLSRASPPLFPHYET